MNVEAEFWRLCEEAHRFDESRRRKLQDDAYSADDVWADERAVERAMVAIIDLVEAHLEDRPTFVRCFADLVLWKRPAPYLLVNGENVDALSLITHRDTAYNRGRDLCIKMKDLVPRQQFEVAIQAAIGSRIIARTTVKAMRPFSAAPL